MLENVYPVFDLAKDKLVGLFVSKPKTTATSKTQQAEQSQLRVKLKQENLQREAQRAIMFKRFNAAVLVMGKTQCSPEEAVRRVDALLDECGISERSFINTATKASSKNDVE